MNETKIGVNKYRLIDYFDVWGNAEDGWEINNLCLIYEELGPIYITDDATDEEIIDYLIAIEYLAPEAKDYVYIESSDECFIEIFEKETDMPIGRLEMI